MYRYNRTTTAFETDILVQTFHGEGHLFSKAAEMRVRALLFDWLDRQ